jgi:hypothetical protein
VSGCGLHVRTLYATVALGTANMVCLDLPRSLGIVAPLVDVRMWYTVRVSVDRVRGRYSNMIPDFVAMLM